MKRIGILLTIEPTWGGAFQYDLAILDGAARLAQDGVEVVIGYSHPSWLPYLERYDFSIYPVPFGYWGRFFGQLLHCGHVGLSFWRSISRFFHPTVRAIVRKKCDLWIFPSQDPWCYLVPVPALATVHDLMHRYERRFPEIGTRWQFSWREWHFRNTCRWSSGILVDSLLGKQHVIDSYGTEPSRLHILPFVAPSYLDVLSPKQEPSVLAGLPQKFIFYPAQFWEHKNHRRLIRAIASLKARFPDIRLVLAGARKNLYVELRELVKQLGVGDEVLFIGYVPDGEMETLYRRARAMIMPTFSGPTNIPPLEAMKMGCPAAVSDIYAMPEQTQGAALLFNPESEEEMAAAIAHLWEDDALCQNLSARGLEVSRNWTKEHFEARFTEIVHAVLVQIGTVTA